MKKRVKRILPLLLAITAIEPVFVSCSEPKSKSEPPAYEVVANFEAWAPDFQSIKLMEGFGKVSRSQEVVRNGQYSAKLNPLGPYWSPTAMATMYFPLKSEALGFDKTNILKYKSLKMSFYNDEETTQKVELSFVTKIQTDKAIIKSAIDSIRLPPKQWYDYEYKINAESLNYRFDLKNILGLALSFENCGSRSLSDAPTIYLDDVIFTNRESEMEVHDDIVLKENEICDFEQLYQQHIFVPYSTKDASVPDISVVRASQEENLIASSGEYVLKVITKGSGVEDDGGEWPGIRLVQKVIEKTNLSKIDPEEWSEYRVVFDVYNNTDVSEYLTVKFGSTVPYGAMFGFSALPRAWTEVSYTFEEIAGFNAWAGSPNEARITNPGDWSIAWQDYKDTALEKVFYFDNFRIEKI